MSADSRRWVGPVLEAGPLARALAEVAREANPEVRVVDRGSYVRILSPEVCEVNVRAVEELLGSSLNLPGDLERVMPSFQGALHFDTTTVSWRVPGRAR